MPIAQMQEKFSRETNILQFFYLYQSYINLISILYQSYITLQSPFVGCFYFVDFQIFKLSNPTRPKKY